MSSSRGINEPEEVDIEKVIDTLVKRGFSVRNVTGDGIVLVNDKSMSSFKDVVVIPAGRGDKIPTSVLKENLRGTALSWQDILPELM